MACADGFFYIYEVNVQTGGECKLLSQTSIEGSPSPTKLFSTNSSSSASGKDVNSCVNTSNNLISNEASSSNCNDDEMPE